MEPLDPTRPAEEERQRLAEAIDDANACGDIDEAEQLLMLDSDLFDVNEEGVEWR